jgi:hypothetical protein
VWIDIHHTSLNRLASTYWNVRLSSSNFARLASEILLSSLLNASFHETLGRSRAPGILLNF